MWNDLLIALSLVFVIEGIMPFVNPDGVRKLFVAASQLDNSTLRFVGFSSMCIGVTLLYIVR